jgi:hypothetical protein
VKLFVPDSKVSPKAKTKAKKKSLPSARNNMAVNAAVDYQKIKTAEIEIPVIAEDVLTYGPGELGAAYPETTNLYYPESAIADQEYLDTVVRSPLQVQTHEKNTGEFNRDVDGWPLSAWYDKDRKRVMVKGVLHGESNVEYAKENLTKPGFGTSAFISFLKIERQKGTAPNGKPYDAIVKKAVNNHIAILPNIRDPKNVIVALNAVEKDEAGDDKTKNEISKQEDIEMPEAKMSDEEFSAYMEKYNAKNKAEEEMRNSIKNEIMEELGIKKGEKGENGKNEDKAEKKEETKSEEKAENPDEKEKDKDDDAEAANAIEPDDAMLKDFSTHLGIAFSKKPTLKALGKIAGIGEVTNTAALISALNAKRKEFTSGSTESGEGKNSKEDSSLDDFLKTI